MTRLFLTFFMAGALALVVVVGALADSIPVWLATATEADDEPVNPVKALGRVFFSESGWSSPADQHLIVTVYERRLEVRSPRRVKRLSYGQQLVWIAKHYSTRTFAPGEVRSVIGGQAKRSRRQLWLNAMGPGCDEPAGWPPEPHPPWSVYESRCQKLFKRARSFVRKHAPGSCSSSIPVDHWGGPMDDWRAERNHWVRVTDWSCVEDGQRFEAQNHVWCDPELSRCGDEPGSATGDVQKATPLSKGRRG